MEYSEDQTIKEHNETIFNKVRELDLPTGSYAISSGGPVAVRGLRKTSDADVIVLPELWDKLKAKYGITLYGENKAPLIRPVPDVDIFTEETFIKIRGTIEGPTIEEQVARAEIIDGLAFQSLADCIWFKKMQAREKDINDIELVKEYLVRHPEENIGLNF